MYNFFNIESPLQLLSAISAAKVNDGEKNILLVNLSKGSRKNNDAQILSLIDYGFWHDVLIKKKTKGLFKDLKTAKFFLSLSLKYKNKIDKYFFGDFRRFDMALLSGILSVKECVLLDDGSYTITAQNHYISNGFFPYSKNIKSKIFFSLIKKCMTPNLYSFFDFKLLDGQINYYEHPPKKNIKTVNENIYFFGSKFSEMKNMSLENEISILRKVLKRYPKNKFFYLPHRDEKENKLKEIESLGYTIKKLNEPAEIFFDKTEEMPKVIISYFSTTLYTCFSRFKNVKVISVDVTDKLLKKNSRNSAKYIYQYYKELGFEVLKL